MLKQWTPKEIQALHIAFASVAFYGNIDLLSSDAALTLARLFLERGAISTAGTEIRNSKRLPIED